MAATIKNVAMEMQMDLEKMKKTVKTEEGQEEEKIGKARAENNEERWSRFGEWRGCSRRSAKM